MSNFKVKCISNTGNTGKYTSGKIYEFKNGQMIDDNGNKTPHFKCNSYEDFLRYTSSEFELVKEISIHITVKDRATHAILKQGNQVIKRAQAICNPSDEFNFEYGANIAFQRLVGIVDKTEVREVKRSAKVGEWIKISKVLFPAFKYKKGDILMVTESSDHTVMTSANSIHCIHDEEYVVLENFQPQQETFDIANVSNKELLAELQRRIELSDNV